jgi:hypothetical protein
MLAAQKSKRVNYRLRNSTYFSTVEKMNLKTSFLLISIIIFSLNMTTFSQSIFRPGYIITLSQDSVQGAIEDQPLHQFSKSLTFKNPNGILNIFGVNDIAEFGFDGGRRFRSVEVSENAFFLNILFEGKASLFALKNVNGQFTYFIDKTGLGIREIPYNEEILRSTNSYYINYTRKKSNGHYGILTLYLADGKNTLKRIADIKKPNENNLLNLLQYYHNEVCPEDKCYIFMDPTPKNRIMAEPTLFLMRHGINALKNHNDFVLHFGGNMYINYPRINDLTGLRIGLAVGFRDYTDNNKKKNSVIFTRINVHALYMYPKGIFRPKVSFGIDIQNPVQLGFGGMLGTNIHITKKTAVSINYDHFLFGLITAKRSATFGGTEDVVLFNPKSISVGLAYDLGK